MKKELQTKLVKKYPEIFIEFGGDPMKTCMAWGLECGDGWYNLIDQLCNDLTIISEPKKMQVIALQVKEKFGGLRFYYTVELGDQSTDLRIKNLLREFMFKKRLGRQYWAIVNFRKKFWKTDLEKISDRIEKAESDSYKTCETCGKPGEARGGGWVRTSCKDCDKKFQEGKRPWGDDWDE